LFYKYNSCDSFTNIYENRFNFIPVVKLDSNLNPFMIFNNNDKIKNNNCCLIKKFIDGNDFKYIYQKYNNSDCDIDNFYLDQNNQLLFDGINNWDNKYCNNNNDFLGSCKHYDFECIDFVDEITCNNYNNRMQLDKQNKKIYFSWSKKPCYNR